MTAEDPALDPDAYGEASFDLFRDVFGEWRWRLRAGSRVLAMAAEAYPDRPTCLERVLWVRANAAAMPVAGGGADRVD
jgi:uncharacterized protein YegP (UPF0339 family)